MVTQNEEQYEMSVAVTPVGHGECVLVVEDEVTLRTALVEIVESLNYVALEAGDGEQALAVLAEHGEKVALVLSDVVMPVMGGIELFQAFRKNGWKMPMILLTGHPMTEEMETLRDQGLKDWLSKPLKPDELARRIKDALRK